MEKEPEKFKAKKALVKYLVWGGTRAHPKAKEKLAYAIIIGNWAYTAQYKAKKKSITANGFEVITIYNRIPKGTEFYFKRIMEELPERLKKNICLS